MRLNKLSIYSSHPSRLGLSDEITDIQAQLNLQRYLASSANRYPHRTFNREYKLVCLAAK